MKKIKWSPILISTPVLILVHTLWIRYICGWTAFSPVLIIGFIIIMLILLLLDRFFLMCVSAKTAWIAETVILVFSILLFFNQCVHIA